MALLNHIRLAAVSGFSAGILSGMIDIIARISKLNFEWFEFYQAMLLSTMLWMILFAVFGFFAGLIAGIAGLKVKEKKLHGFYSVAILPVLLFFYGEIFVNRYLFGYLPRWPPWNNPLRIILSIGVIALAIYICSRLIKCKGFMKAISGKKTRNFAKNLAFILAVFIIVSFFIDLHALNAMPVSSQGTSIEKPNVLLIVLDTVRADHLSVYNYTKNTSPNLDKLAQDSAVFDNAVSVTSWTLPAHASIFTGKYPSSHKASKIYQKLDYEQTTLAEILSSEGYNTAGFVGAAFTKAKYGIGQGFTTYKDRLDFFEHAHTFDRFSIRNLIYFLFPDFHNAVFMADGEKIAEETNKDVFKWLDKNKDSSFFMFINYYDAHYPYNLGEEFRDQFTSDTRNYRKVENALNTKRYGEVAEADVKYMIDRYDTEIFYLDSYLGKLFDKLDELGIKDNTIIIITSDHGEEFYDHGYYDHGNTLYEEVIHVPLIIYYPKELEAKRIEKRISTASIFPAVLDMLGMDIPKDIDSLSLVPLMKNEEGYNQEYVYSELLGRSELGESSQQAISIYDWKLIEVKPEEETVPSALFNLAQDPGEKENLYDAEALRRAAMQEYLSGVDGD